jgi:RimJ/RimL family protein N-acetyltransferase
VASETLHTERLVLLPLGPADLDEAAALFADPEVMRFVADGAMDRSATAKWLEDVARSWRSRGFGLWAIRDAATGAFLGEGGLQTFPGALSLPDLEVDPEVDFGYTFCRRSWGQGYSIEAGEVMLEDAWRRYRGSVIHAIVTSDNIPSQKVLRKLGFARVERLEHLDRPHQLWAVTRPR